MGSLKLYELTEQIQKLQDFEYDYLNHDEQEAFSELYNGLTDAVEIKADGVARLIKNLESESDAISAEVKRLQDRKKALENKIDSVKSYLKREMERIGIKKIQSSLFTISIQDNPPATRVDETLLDDQWWRIKKEPDVSRIKEALKEGEEILGARLEVGTSLRIR